MYLVIACASVLNVAFAFEQDAAGAHQIISSCSCLNFLLSTLLSHGILIRILMLG